MPEVANWLASIGETDLVDIVKGVAILAIAASIAFLASRLFNWASRSRRRDQIDAVTQVIEQKISPTLASVEHGQEALADKVDEMTRQNAIQHDAMRERMTELARDHAETRERVAVIEHHINQERHA